MVKDLKWWYVWRGIDRCTQNGDLWWLCPDGETRTQARIDIPASHGEARWSCAYDSCRHASAQIRKTLSTEVMLANATEDFVPQFGDEVGGRYSSQWGDRWGCSHRSAFSIPWNKESRRFSYFKSWRLKRWLSVHDLQVGFQFDLQSARIVWFERERKLRRTQSRNQSKLFVIRTKIRLSMIWSQVPTIETVQKTVEVVPQAQFLIEWWMCQLLMVCVSQCPNTAIQRYTSARSCV